MNLSIIPDAIWKIVYNYAIDDISDLITADTDAEDFNMYTKFLDDDYFTTINNHRIVIACVKCQNAKLLIRVLYDMDVMTTIENYTYIMEIICKKGYIKMYMLMEGFCMPSTLEESSKLLTICLKNLHFDIAIMVYNRQKKLYPRYAQLHTSIYRALEQCKSFNREKIRTFVEEQWKDLWFEMG